MCSVSHPKIRLDLLPKRILCMIVEFLFPEVIESVSCVNKQLREICVPYLFRKIKVEFSKAGFDGLRSLSESALRQHVSSLTYLVPLLLDPDVFDSKQFQTHVFTLDNYVRTISDQSGSHNQLNAFPSYTVACDLLRDIYEEQQMILEGKIDVEVLSFTLRNLPNLQSIHLCFCLTTEEEDWISGVLGPMALADHMVALEHHVETVSAAAKAARKQGVGIRSVHLCHLEHPPVDLWNHQSLSSLTTFLGTLLDDTLSLQLSGSDLLLELLPNIYPRPKNVCICDLAISIERLGWIVRHLLHFVHWICFHNVDMASPGQSERRPLLPLLLEISIDSPNIHVRKCSLFHNFGYHRLGWELMVR